MYLVNFIWGVGYAVLGVLALIEAVSRIRTYLQAKKYGILKAHIPANSLVITICIVALLFIAFLAMIVQGNSAKQELAALGIQYDSYAELYSIPDIHSNDHLYSTVKKVRELAFFPPAIWITIIYYILVGFKRTLYITEAGLFARKIDTPIEISALRRGDMIDIYLKEDTAHFKTLFSLNSSPKNLAALGKFIDWND